MSRRSRRRGEEIAERASELKDQAKEVAGQSSEALKDFASKTKDAAKELLETIEQAAKEAQAETQPKKKSRRFVKTVLAIGAGVAVFTNERARNAIKSVLNRGGTDEESQPDVWRPQQTTTGNGTAEKTPSVTEQS